ncbi:unnamed protein product [Dovyalis caffra]|uniref:Uncharacterized protein n=1 Tax=Dovyalis caffra TaxID=77055 RepID=A0AAV1S2S0_9ROSI|nr:unnamed protein product [Dovyalis caffra]
MILYPFTSLLFKKVSWRTVSNEFFGPQPWSIPDSDNHQQGLCEPNREKTVCTVINESKSTMITSEESRD